MYAPPPKLNLVVIRSPDIDRAATFYQNLGLLFIKHSHGNGPEHYTSEVDGMVFEVYPLADTQTATTGTRLGFIVDDVDSLVTMLVEMGTPIVSAPQDSPWGRRAVVKDFDGHSIELTTLFPVSQPPLAKSAEAD